MRVEELETMREIQTQQIELLEAKLETVDMMVQARMEDQEKEKIEHLENKNHILI